MVGGQPAAAASKDHSTTMKSLVWAFNDRSAVVEAIAAAGGIEPLVTKGVALLRDGDVECKMNAAGALASLAEDDAANQAAIRAAGGIKPLVALVCDGDVAFKTNAAGVLATLAKCNAAFGAAIRAAGAIEPLVALLRDADAQGKTYAAAALATLAESHSVKVLLVL
jgi:hypothetical protein